MPKKPPRKGLIVLYVLAVILFLAMVYCGYRLLSIEAAYGKSRDSYEKLQEQYRAPGGTSPALADVDFAALKEVNSDVVAWLTMTGTPIDYPVAQGEDNQYYLKHLFTKDPGVAGCLFLDAANDRDFGDANSVIYGHHMKNSSMFGSLDGFKEQSYYEEHPSLTLYTPDRVYTVELFAAYVVKSNSEEIPTSFASAADFTAYVDQAKARSCFQSGLAVTAGDRILTLYTCAYSSDDARFIVQGVLREK